MGDGTLAVAGCQPGDRRKHRGGLLGGREVFCKAARPYACLFVHRQFSSFHNVVSSRTYFMATYLPQVRKVVTTVPMGLSNGRFASTRNLKKLDQSAWEVIKFHRAAVASYDVLNARRATKMDLASSQHY